MAAVQTIQTIKIKDMGLWSENPRDPIEITSSDYEIIKRAIEDNPKEWNLDKMAKEMGVYYDLSEIPTVVFVNNKPVVYDGNRRVAVLKYLQNEQLYSALTGKLFFGDGPKGLKELKQIPCNVCNEETALTNIERKHSMNGSWGTLQREYFLHRHRGKEKSLFLEFEDRTGIISKHPKMNQRFVKDEVLTEKNLEDIGFSYDVKKGIVTNYSIEEGEAILDNVVSAVNNNVITTRSDNRGKLKYSLIKQHPELEKKLKQFNKNKKLRVLDTTPKKTQFQKRKTPIIKQNEQIFGRTLVLRSSPVNDLYRAINSIYESYQNDSKQLEIVLPIIGMALRLILDVAARTYHEEQGNSQANEDQLYKEFLKIAKKDMSMSQKNINYLSFTSSWLSDKEKIDGLLAKFAHGNIVTQKTDILKASIVVGDILEEYFKK